MSLLDLALLGAVLATALWRILFPRKMRRLLRLAPAGLAALSALQFALEGFFWQALPAYLLIFALALLSFRREPARPGLARLAGRIGLAALLMIAVAPWMLLLPTPTLVRPQGPYLVGAEVFRWTDAARGEEATREPGDQRNVIVQAWYPTIAGADGPRTPYIDGLPDLPAQVALIPGFVMRSYGRIDTHAVRAAPVSPDRPTWPVVIFSPGYGAPRAFYTGLSAGLASRGYVVLAIDHPYESAIVELADGTMATPRHVVPTDEAGAEAAMESQLKVRVADIRFVLDQIETAHALGPRLSGRLDLRRIFAAGHSFGGAASAVAMGGDARIKAAANIDGTPYGDIPALDRPFLLIESDRAETGHGEAYLRRNQAILDLISAPGWRFEIDRANHYSFTDAPLFFAPPGRLALSLLIGGSRGPQETLGVTLDLLDAFFAEPNGADLEEVVARHAGVSGGRASSTGGMSP